MSTTTPTSWTEAELLATDPGIEPLIVGGYRCHGGFDDDGRYHSPRTRFRVPAIEAWQQQHREQFGTELLDVPLDDLARRRIRTSPSRGTSSSRACASPRSRR